MAPSLRGVAVNVPRRDQGASPRSGLPVPPRPGYLSCAARTHPRAARRGNDRAGAAILWLPQIYGSAAGAREALGRNKAEEVAIRGGSPGVHAKRAGASGRSRGATISEKPRAKPFLPPGLLRPFLMIYSSGFLPRSRATRPEDAVRGNK